jgi:inorganic triphosphatase YgiF
MGSETELKLGLKPEYSDDVASLALLQEYQCAPPQVRQLDNTYFDTPDHRLRRAGVALRIRRDGGRFIQTLKSAKRGQGGLSVRAEWEWERPDATLDLALLREHLPEALRAPGLLDQLVPLFDTGFERRLWWLGGECDGEPWRVEVALDQGCIDANGQQMPLSELELELQQGTPDTLFQLAAEIARQVPLQVSDVSKAQRGYQLCGASSALPQVDAVWTGSDNDSLVALIGSCLRAWPRQLLAATDGDETALEALAQTMDLLLAALEYLPAVAEQCQVLISQYQRLRAEIARAHDWRLLTMMPAQWQQAQREQARERLAALSHKTLPGQLALATGELLWQLSCDAEAERAR